MPFMNKKSFVVQNEQINAIILIPTVGANTVLYDHDGWASQ